MWCWTTWPPAVAANSAVDAPTRHEAEAALIVAQLIDEAGNHVVDAREAYTLALTQGTHRRHHLEVGESLLIEAGFLEPRGDRLVPTAALFVLANLDTEASVAALTRRVMSIREVAGLLDRDAIGAAGEQAVADECAEELSNLGHPDLAKLVRRVSLVDDTAGFDVHAPTIGGDARLLEVKTTVTKPVGHFPFFISRNEYDIGRRNATAWALVACAASADLTSVEVVGWCRASDLRPYLPEDRSGRWTEAQVRLPMASLSAGIPPAI